MKFNVAAIEAFTYLAAPALIWSAAHIAVSLPLAVAKYRRG